MSDARFRELERLALNGSDIDKAALITAALRAGWPLPQVEAAADLWHVPSCLALGRKTTFRGLQSSLVAILRDETIDPEVFHQIACDILDFVRRKFPFNYSGYGIPNVKKLWPALRAPGKLTNRNREKIWRLSTEMGNDAHRRYALFGHALEGFLVLDSLSVHGRRILDIVMRRLSDPIFRWPRNDDHKAFRAFFLNRLVPSAAV